MVKVYPLSPGFRATRVLQRDHMAKNYPNSKNVDHQVIDLESFIFYHMDK